MPSRKVSAAIVSGVATEAEAKAKAHAAARSVMGGETSFHYREPAHPGPALATKLSTTDLDLLTGVLLVQGKVLANGVRPRGE